jgi:hypothetical protein
MIFKKVSPCYANLFCCWSNGLVLRALGSTQIQYERREFSSCSQRANTFDERLKIIC